MALETRDTHPLGQNVWSCSLDLDFPHQLVPLGDPRIADPIHLDELFLHPGAIEPGGCVRRICSTSAKSFRRKNIILKTANVSASQIRTDCLGIESFHEGSGDSNGVERRIRCGHGRRASSRTPTWRPAKARLSARQTGSDPDALDDGRRLTRRFQQRTPLGHAKRPQAQQVVSLEGRVSPTNSFILAAGTLPIPSSLSGITFMMGGEDAKTAPSQS